MERMATLDDATNGESGLLAMIGGNGGGGGDGGEGGIDGGVGGGNVEEMTLKKGPWTTAEDAILMDYVTKHGEGNWNAVQRNTGLNRCGKSCRLRWANHLRPNLKKGAFSPEEEKLIIDLHSQFGNKWARMAALLPGRTDNEIKNYWNTRIKRRQRQGLPLYSDDYDHHHPTTPTTSSATPTGSNPNTTTKFEFFNQNHHLHHHHQQQQQHPLSPTAPHHHSPLTSPLQHRPSSSYSSHTFLDPSHLPLSSSAPSPLSFTFQRPAPVLCSPLRFKRYRASPSYNFQVPSIAPCSSALPDPSVTTQLTDFEGFRFPVQLNSSFSQFLQPPLLESDLGVSSSSSSSAFTTKLELPPNQFSRPPQEQDIKHDIEFNDAAFQTSSGLLGDLLLDAQALASGPNSKKRGYLSLNEGNDVFDGCQSFEDLPLSSVYWSASTSGAKPKEEAPDLSKFMNEDLSSLLTVIPSSNMQGQNWYNNHSAPEASNVQSSGSVMTDDNFGLDTKPIASLFPLTNTSNHNGNPGCYSWDNLPGLC